jgi:hypothetical protein
MNVDDGTYQLHHDIFNYALFENLSLKILSVRLFRFSNCVL